MYFIIYLHVNGYWWRLISLWEYHDQYTCVLLPDSVHLFCNNQIYPHLCPLSYSILSQITKVLALVIIQIFHYIILYKLLFFLYPRPLLILMPSLYFLYFATILWISYYFHLIYLIYSLFCFRLECMRNLSNIDWQVHGSTFV